MTQKAVIPDSVAQKTMLRVRRDVVTMQEEGRSFPVLYPSECQEVWYRSNTTETLRVAKELIEEGHSTVLISLGFKNHITQRLLEAVFQYNGV